MVLTLDHLPEEILHNILSYCHPCSSSALEQTSWRFRAVTNEPLLWRYYCRAYFKFWAHKHAISQKFSGPISAVDWKALYVCRHLIDRETSLLLDSILASQTGRIEKFQAIVEFGYDAKDTLLRNILTDSEAEDYLARRYYAKALLTCLHRSIVVPEWSRLRNGGSVPLVKAIGAFDLFLPECCFGDLDEISTRLDEIVSSLRLDLPEVDKLCCREKAKAVATYLRAHNMTGIEQGQEYHSLEHNFLGVALNDPSHNSLPLVSAAIYCHIAQRLGLNACPCGFPFHVHVIVMPPLGYDVDGKALDSKVRGEPIYMDPFHSDKETSVMDLKTQLDFLGASPAEQTTFLGESRTAEIVLRCSKNILNSVQRVTRFPGGQLPQVDVLCAKYAALWCSLILSDPARPADIRLLLSRLMEIIATDFPSDINLIEKHICPILRGTDELEHVLESLHVIRAVDEIPKQRKPRSPKDHKILYHVGQVLRHRRYNYIAIITGWDSECGADELWMRRMGIDRLQSGRHQSFYHVLVEDKSVRYVAEENIQIIAPNISELPSVLVAVAGKHFKRWDEERREFISNIRDEYPDD